MRFRVTLLALAAPLVAQREVALRTFEKQQLATDFFCEGATFGDLDRDGDADLIAGPFWYEGPAFEVRHELYAPKPFDRAGYSDNFFAFVRDFDADGWNDVLVIGFPGKDASWFRNPGKADAHWQRHQVFATVDNESPAFTDLTGDGQPELVCQFEDRLGYAAVDWTDPARPWTWHPISVTGIGGRFTHGLGIGDLDGDGRSDVLWKHGWWRQPESLAGDPVWENKPVKFADRGGAQMLVYDIDGDGDNDVVSSENAHGFGLHWFEQTRQDGAIRFERHTIMGATSNDSPYGLAVGNLHAACLADVDKNGLLDVITGNRYWAHSGKDDADRDEPPLHWFALQRTDGVARFVPHEIDGNSGVGTQVVAGDVDGDGEVDVVVGNKMGTFVHRQRVRMVSPQALRTAERREIARALQRATDARIDRRGELPRGKDGAPLNLDFEAGDLRHWRVDGPAFAKNPNDGDTVAARRDDMRSAHAGRYWVGSYEPTRSDKTEGTLTSEPFRTEKPFASFLVGGGRARETRVELVRADTGEAVFTASGRDDEAMRPVVVDLRPYRGVDLFVRVVDGATGHWGHVNFDDFLLHDESPAVGAADAKTGGFTPAESRARFELPPGFRAELFAAEPDVRQPIAFAIDTRGRLWVAQGFTYPQRRAEGEGQDAIVVFDDEDGDGRFDRRTEFATGLNLVSGLEVGFGGVWVGAAPYLLFIPDQNGDLAPDGPPEVLLDGWHYEDTHETLNSFTWGPDGWLYGCHGVFTHSLVGKPGTPDDRRQPIDAGVWRYHPTRHEFEVFAWGTSNPWGIDFDDRGQALITACVIPHLWHVIQGARYERQAGRHFDAHGYVEIGTIADHLHYLGSTPHGGNGLSNSVGGGHAHCGALIYRGGRFPAPFRDALFMANVHGHRVNTDVLRREGSGFVGSHGADFLVAHDESFMAIDFEYGPDGNVFLIDWYDEQSCHLSEPERWDRSNGRIYKISYGDAKPVRVDIERESDARLVELLFDENEWFARRARRVLQQRGGSAEVAAALLRVARSDADEGKRLRALWGLHVIGRLDQELIAALLSDAGEFVRAWTIQLALEDRALSAPQLRRCEALAASDPSPVVRLYLASALQRLPIEQRWEIATRLVAHGEDAADHNLPVMIWYGIEPAVAADAERAVALAEASHIPSIAELVLRRLAAAGGDALTAALRALPRRPTPDALAAALTAIRQGVGARSKAAMPAVWPELFRLFAAHDDLRVRDAAVALAAAFGDADVRPMLAAIAADRAAAPARRTWALGALIETKDEALGTALRELVADPLLGERAVRALAALDDPGTPRLLVGSWGAFGTATRRAAVTTLCSRPAWAMELLDAIDQGVVPRTALDAPVRLQLAQLADAALAERVERVWGRSIAPSESTRAAIDRWKRTLTTAKLASADRSAGRALFAKTCMACHRLFGAGTEIGPDITGSNRADLDYILANLVDPSAEVAREYMMATVRLKSGAMLAGMIAEETEASVKVHNAGVAEVVARADIATIERLPISLMPPGQLDALSEADARDLVAYLAGDAQVPMRATPENAELFFNGVDLTLWSADPAVWSVESGEIVGRTKGLARNDFAVSDLLVRDFELTLEVKLVGDAGNSGIQFRSARVDGGEMRGLQADVGPGWWGKVYDENGRGLVWPQSGEAFVARGEWNTYRVLAEGDRIRTWINGKECADLRDQDGAREGVIGLQVHSGGPTEVRFRKLQLSVR